MLDIELQTEDYIGVTKYEKYGKFLNVLEEKPEILEFILTNIYKSPDNTILVKAVDMRKSLGDSFETMDELEIKNGLEFSLFLYGIFLSVRSSKYINPETDERYMLLKFRIATIEDKLSEYLSKYIEPIRADIGEEVKDMTTMVEKVEKVPEEIKNILEEKINNGEWPEHYRLYTYQLYKESPFKKDTLPYTIRNIIRNKKIVSDYELRNLVRQIGYSDKSGSYDGALRVLQVVTKEINISGIKTHRKYEWIGGK